MFGDIRFWPNIWARPYPQPLHPAMEPPNGRVGPSTCCG